MASGTINAHTSRICIELIYKKKTQCNEDQMRNHTGNFHKKPKHCPHQKPAPAKSGFGQYSDIMASEKRNQTSPQNCPPPSNLALALNPSQNFFMVTFQSHSFIGTYTQKRCKAMTSSELRN